jgi:hypothetical protein
MRANAGSHEQALAARGVRKELGAYYTPPDVVAGLLDVALEPLLAERAVLGAEAVAAIRVLDPACGTGNFLVAAAERIAAALVRLGVDDEAARKAAVRGVHGVEIDDGTARRCRAALKGVHPDGGGRSVVRGDALLDGVVPDGRFDLVVGNPPFLSQLASTTARTRTQAVALRTRFGSAVGPYTDPAAVFLLAALRAARPDGGTVALVEPVALLSARDAAGVRAAALDAAALVCLWIAEEPVFDADVEVCAPVLVRGSVGSTTTLVRGRRFAPGPIAAAPATDAGSWSPLLGALQDLPVRDVVGHGVLGDIADATADFRDQYYGLADSVVDRAEGPWPRLVTSGLIDPALLLWGERPCRFNKMSYHHPRVDVAALDPAMRDWAARRLVPKVLVATQTRVLEAVVDERGELLPSVPVVTVTARSGDQEELWRIGALVSSPVTALVASHRHLGAGRNATALRLSASDLMALPLPADRGAWDEAAAAFAAASASADPEVRRALLRASAASIGAAFGLHGDDRLVDWWAARLPQGRAVGSGPKAAATRRS